MASSQPNHKPVVQEHHAWVKKRTIAAYDLSTGRPETTRGFVPISAVDSYLKDNHYRKTRLLLTAVFGTEEEAPVSARDVAEHFPRLFCLLLHLGKAQYIETFVVNNLSDRRLPFEEQPKYFPTDTDDANFWKNFYEKQWQFSAPVLDNRYNVRFDEDYILPFTELKDPRYGRSATVYKATVHVDHDELANPKVPGNCYALKVFKPGSKDYDRERAAFKRITESSTRHVQGMIRFYGSFEYQNTFSIVLEYADGGTLEDYLRTCRPPSNSQQLLNFWAGLLGTTTALWKIHDHHLNPDERGEGVVLHGWHQDLKPENILVVSNGRPSPYEWQFKIADLGSSRFREIMVGENEPAALNSNATRTYGAPECYLDATSAVRGSRRITRSVDIWSLGAMYSEAAVWTARGVDALDAYRRDRKHETDRLSDFRDGNCFHNGTKRLDTVDKHHQEIRDYIRADDFITGQVLDVIVIEMLEFKPEHRPTAQQLVGKVDRAVKSASDRLRKNTEQNSQQLHEPGPPSTPTHTPRHSPPTTSPRHQANWSDSSDRVLPGPSRLFTSPRPTSMYPITQSDPSAQGQPGNAAGLPRRGTSTRQPLPLPLHESAEELGAALENMEINPMRSPPSDPPPYLSKDGLSEWWRQVNGPNKSEAKLPFEDWFYPLKGREHVFIVDDSRSMEPHWNDLIKLVGPLAKILKRYDPNKLELYFLGSDASCVTSRASRLCEFLRNHPANKRTNLNTRLDADLLKYREALDRSRQSRSRMSKVLDRGREVNLRSIYIFTDGVWENGHDEQGHESILAMVKKLSDLGLPREQIGIQFIRFGTNDIGKRRLEFLDKIKYHFGLEKDIVDTEPADGNVCKMLLGAINPKFDDDPQEMSPIDAYSPPGRFSPLSA